MRTHGLAQLVEYEDCQLWLYRRLGELDVLGSLEPRFEQWLAQRARRVVAQNMLVDAQVDAIVRALNELAIPHIFIKGAARRLVGTRYPYADARATHDVDVLLPGQFAQSVWDHLRSVGFALATDHPEDFKEHIHLPPLVSHSKVAVELHTSTSEKLTPDEAWHRISGSAQRVRRGGEVTRIPTATELFWHAITHAPLRWPYAFRIRCLQDAAVIWAADDQVDWSEVASRLESAEIRDVALARRWLSAAAWLSGCSDIDARLGAAESVDLPKLLRWRSRVLDRGISHRQHNGTTHHVDGLVARGQRLLIDEGTRIEVALSPTPPPPNTGALARAGRRLASAVAGLTYRSWRALHS